jgi:ribonuclease D
MGCCTSVEVAGGISMSARGPLSVLRGDLPGELADAFAGTSRVAWDVETSGLDWRHDRLGTCQLFADEIGVVVVILTEALPSHLAALLGNPAVEKIFHHAPFDLRFMVHAWQATPESIRCTKVASKLLSPLAPNEDHSLQSLIFRHLGVRLQKGAVRTSNWTAGHLTAPQIEYAAGDVIHLPRLLSVLESELNTARLATLYDECCAFLPARARLELGGYPDVFAY